MKKVYKYINVIVAVAIIGALFQSCTPIKQGCPERISTTFSILK